MKAFPFFGLSKPLFPGSVLQKKRNEKIFIAASKQTPAFLSPTFFPLNSAVVSGKLRKGAPNAKTNDHFR
jgi:hypothetical protein